MKVGTLYEVQKDRHSITLSEMSFAEYTAFALIVERGMQSIAADDPELYGQFAEIVVGHKSTAELRTFGSAGQPE
jgi:hypothetical protein